MFLPVLSTLFLCAVNGWLLYRWNASRLHAIPHPWLLAAFTLRIAMSIVYGYIFITYYNGDDTWMLHMGIEEEYRQLISDPTGFFLEPFYAGELVRHESFTTGMYYYLMDLENWIICKPLALLQPVTGGNYYCQAVLYNMLTFWGNLLLYRYFVNTCPGFKNGILFWLFFFPPLLFWWSGLRSDGMILLCTALLLQGMRGMLQEKKRAGLTALLVGAAGMMIMRIQLLFLWVPALAAYTLHQRFRMSHWRAIGAVYGAAALIFFGSGLISPRADLTRWVVERQQQFKALPGKTRFELRDLEPGVAGFLKTLPQATANIFLRPTLWEARGALQWLAAGDVLVLLLLLGLFLITKGYSFAQGSWPPEIIYPFLFALSLYLFIGFTIPFPGAIVRYKVQAEYIILIFLSMRLRFFNHINIFKI